jgi:hypothetical protein
MVRHRHLPAPGGAAACWVNVRRELKTRTPGSSRSCRGTPGRSALPQPDHWCCRRRREAAYRRPPIRRSSIMNRLRKLR